MKFTQNSVKKRMGLLGLGSAVLVAAAALGMHGFQILGTAVTILRPFELKIPFRILYHAALGRKAETYYRKQGVPLFFFQQAHCLRQPVRCNKRSGGIDTAQGIKIVPRVFHILPALLPAHPS